ncbi:ATP-binding region, ATPase-like domain protein, partial [Candidatus Magnetomorum sp. HK-1]
KDLDHDIKEILDESFAAVKRIQDLASEFLQYLQPIDERRSKVNITNILKQVQGNSTLKNKCTIELSIDEQANEIWAHKSGLQWVFEELLQNAIKHRKKDPFLKIIVKAKMDNKDLIISFQDNGTGIPEHIQNKIFDPFFSEDRNSGTGLGLTNIKKIIEENGGIVYLDNSYNDGASFIIKFSDIQKMKGNNIHE